MQPLHHDPVPGFISTGEFIIEPLLSDHVSLDYEAVMSSKEYLRKWSQSSWPTDQFTLEENLTDLVRHEKEHVENLAYTYTILKPDKMLCLGCIYIKPIEWIRDVSLEEKNKLRSKTAFLSFWVRTSIRNHPLEESIFKFLLDWMNNYWQFPAICYATNHFVPQQISLFQKNSLFLWMKLSQPNRYQSLWNESILGE
jgi:hypothetical protein